MKISFNWLKEFVEISESPQEISARLTMAGIEVESLVALDREDWVLEVAVPANRGDCLSVMGLAREVAAITGAKARIPDTKLQAKGVHAQDIGVKIEDSVLCPRYSARFVAGLQVRFGDQLREYWLENRLRVARDGHPIYARGKIELCPVDTFSTPRRLVTHFSHLRSQQSERCCPGIG